MAGGASLIAAPAIVSAQAPLKVSFVQQRGLMYLPVDMMVSGGVLQQEATKLGLGKVEATAQTLSGPAPVIDALLSGSADYGTAALPSLLTLWDKTHGTAERSQGGRHHVERRHGALHHQSEHQDASPISPRRTASRCRRCGSRSMR